MISSTQKPQPANTQKYSYKSEFLDADGIRARNLNKRLTAETRRRPRGHWRPSLILNDALNSSLGRCRRPKRKWD
jgi:hypothetical protein